MGPVLILFLIFSAASSQNPIQEFTTANNLFAQSVYKQVASRQAENFLVSPFSAETILAYVHSGSRGETAGELRKALYLPEDKNRVGISIQTLLSEFKLDYCHYTLRIANKVYLKKNFVVCDQFKRDGNLFYGVETESIDFFPDAVQASRTINNWVEEHTNYKIKNLMDYNDFDESTKAVLVNALYFKANWSNPFSPLDTKKENFYKEPNEVVKADTLHHCMKYFKYYECPDLKAQFLELPFKGDDLSMVIVLPNAKNGLSHLENQMDKVFSQQRRMRSQFLNVALPKFKIETSIDLKEVLNGLGVKKIFLEQIADLSWIAGRPGDLYIKKAAQKTFIDVSEEGVEAAAATYVILSHFKSLGVPTEFPKEFIADHPFIFCVKVKGVIIFAGRVTDPLMSH